MKEAGCYQLLIHLPKSRTILVGRLGKFDFPAGWYIYTGSAKKGLEARLRRHLAREKRLHWHIDFLLEHARVKGIKKYLTGRLPECVLSRCIISYPKGKVVAKKFGSTDCRCKTHLVFFQEKPDIHFEQVN